MKPYEYVLTADKSHVSYFRGNFLTRTFVSGIISFGGGLILRTIENVARKAGVDVDKIKKYCVENQREIAFLSSLSRKS